MCHMGLATIVNGDARWIPLADGSVDAIVTDPPYGQSNEAYDSDVAFRPAVWRECYRVAGANAALVSFAGSPTYHRIASAIEAAGWKVRQMWAWIYRDGMITSAYPSEGFDRLSPAMDPIVYATKGKVLLHATRQGDAWRRTRKTAGYSERASIATRTEAGGHFPRTVVSDDDVPGFEYFMLGRSNYAARHEGPAHPNRKPLALMQWLVSRIPGRVILDPFAGSGTTIAAAASLGRGGIGIELNPEYARMAMRRIDRPHASHVRPARRESHPLFEGASWDS